MSLGLLLPLGAYHWGCVMRGSGMASNQLDIDHAVHGRGKVCPVLGHRGCDQPVGNL